MATCGDVPERRGFLAIPRAERSDKACSFDFCCSPTRGPFFQRQHAENGTERPPLLGPDKGRRLEAKRGRPGPPHRQPAKWKRLSWERRMRDASRRETGRLRRGARPLSSQKATQIARKWETPNQAVPPIRDLLREVFPTLAGQWAGGRRPSPAHLRQVRPGGSGPPRGGGDPLPGGRLSLRSGGGGFVSPLGSELPQKRFKKGSIGCKNRPKSVQKRPSRSRRKAGPGHGIPRGGNFCQPTLPVLTGRLRCRPAHIRRLCSGRLLSAHCLQLL